VRLVFLLCRPISLWKEYIFILALGLRVSASAVESSAVMTGTLVNGIGAIRAQKSDTDFFRVGVRVVGRSWGTDITR
jgi:hypothetical protein